MRKTGKCPKCASTNLIEGARLVDRGPHYIRYDLEVAVQKNPEAPVFKCEHRGTLAAWICVDWRRQLKVDRDVPVHGAIEPFAQLVATIRAKPGMPATATN